MIEPLAILIALGTVFAIMIGGLPLHHFRPGFARDESEQGVGAEPGLDAGGRRSPAVLVEAGSLPVMNAVPGVAPYPAALRP